ncbi:hypothetical protein IAU60_003179 [Kwoniella sp. DSM 27419]
MGAQVSKQHVVAEPAPVSEKSAGEKPGEKPGEQPGDAKKPTPFDSLTPGTLDQWRTDFDKVGLGASSPLMSGPHAGPLPPRPLQGRPGRLARVPTRAHSRRQGLQPEPGRGLPRPTGQPGQLGPLLDLCDEWVWEMTPLTPANVLRYNVIEQLKLGEFELSQNYLFFYDKLEKANYYLDRLVSWLNSSPVNDGEKYGIVPKGLYPEAFSSTASTRLDTLLTSKLREYGLRLRAHPSRELKAGFMKEVHTMLSIALGTPPGSSDALTWDYYDRDGRYHSWKGTPRDFYQLCRRKHMDPKDSFSLINDPRNDYGKLYSVERLGNVWEGRPVRSGTPLFFGCDVGKSSSTADGVMDCDLYNLQAAYGFSLGMTKAERLQTGESAMTHAMVITAVHLGPDGRPTKYKVENSWSDTAGEKGWFMMTSRWFQEYVFQVVVPPSIVAKHWADVLDTPPVMLKPWDPMLYTNAVAARPQLELVALCDTNSDRMDHHNGLLKEAGRKEAAKYQPVSAALLFNYRYNPVHWKVAEVIAEGKIGNVKSVHFEWLLDTVHGADYFRRWHRYKDRSGGLMVHKSSHHSKPKSVFGMGNLAFYGTEQGKKSGWAREYDRARGAKAAEDDPFAIHLEDDAGLKALYHDAEHIDHYHRDMNVFADDITIEDDMSVLVNYASGPWEGYRVMFNGDQGRLEVEVVESTHRTPAKKGGAEDLVHGDKALSHEGHSKITLQRLWHEKEDVPYVVASGGGDEAMLDQIFGPVPGRQPRQSPINRLSADQTDGALAMAVGLAANESFKTGKLVHIKELLGRDL